MTTRIDARETAAFGVFVSAAGDIALDPAANRVFLVFTDPSGVSVAGTSLAVATAP